MKNPGSGTNGNPDKMNIGGNDRQVTVRVEDSEAKGSEKAHANLQFFSSERAEMRRNSGGPSSRSEGHPREVVVAIENACCSPASGRLVDSVLGVLRPLHRQPSPQEAEESAPLSKPTVVENCQPVNLTFGF